MTTPATPQPPSAPAWAVQAAENIIPPASCFDTVKRSDRVEIVAAIIQKHAPTPPPADAGLLCEKLQLLREDFLHEAVNQARLQHARKSRDAQESADIIRDAIALIAPTAPASGSQGVPSCVIDRCAVALETSREINDEHVKILSTDLRCVLDGFVETTTQLETARSHDEAVCAALESRSSKCAALEKKVRGLDLLRQRHGIELNTDPVKEDETSAIESIVYDWNNDRNQRAKETLRKFCSTHQDLNGEWALLMVEAANDKANAIATAPVSGEPTASVPPAVATGDGEGARHECLQGQPGDTCTHDFCKPTTPKGSNE